MVGLAIGHAGLLWWIGQRLVPSRARLVAAEHAGVGGVVIAVHRCLLDGCLLVGGVLPPGRRGVGSVVWLGRSGQGCVVGGDVAGLLLTGFGWSRPRHWDLVGPGGRVGLEATVVAVVEVAAD